MPIVPNVVGQTLRQAAYAITQAHLTIHQLKAHDPTVPNGIIISQSPEPGVELPTYAPVDAVMSLGPEV